MTNRELVARLRTAALPGTNRHALDCEAADAIERMAAWLEGDCECPCCMETRQCLDDCTFSEDAPDDAERMQFTREALYGPIP